MTTTEFFSHRPFVVLLVSAVASVVTFVAYALDKRAARRGARRVPENTLHLWSLLGGWPAALVAQRLFRHKTRKTSFQIVFWLSVLLNGAAVAWWLSPAGQQFPGSISETADPKSDLPVIRPQE